MIYRTSKRPLLTLAVLLGLAPLLTGATGCERGQDSSPQPVTADELGTEPGGAMIERLGAPEPASEPRRLAIAELRHLMEVLEEPVLLVDVRSRQSYALGHAKGAVSLPLSELPQRASDELPEDVLLVTYCT